MSRRHRTEISAEEFHELFVQAGLERARLANERRIEAERQHSLRVLERTEAERVRVLDFSI